MYIIEKINKLMNSYLPSDIQKKTENPIEIMDDRKPLFLT